MAHQIASAYGSRPSELIEIDHPLLAYNFDKFVWLYGTKVDSLLSETDKNGKRKHKLRKALRIAREEIRGDKSSRGSITAMLEMQGEITL